MGTLQREPARSALVGGFLLLSEGGDPGEVPGRVSAECPSASQVCSLLCGCAQVNGAEGPGRILVRFPCVLDLLGSSWVCCYLFP